MAASLVPPVFARFAPRRVGARHACRTRSVRRPARLCVQPYVMVLSRCGTSWGFQAPAAGARSRLREEVHREEVHRSNKILLLRYADPAQCVLVSASSATCLPCRQCAESSVPLCTVSKRDPVRSIPPPALRSLAGASSEPRVWLRPRPGRAVHDAGPPRAGLHARASARTHTHTCTHACTHTHTHTVKHTHTHARTHTHTHAHTHTHSQTRAHAGAQTRPRALSTHTHTRARVRARTHTNTRAHAAITQPNPLVLVPC